MPHCYWFPLFYTGSRQYYNYDGIILVECFMPHVHSYDFSDTPSLSLCIQSVCLWILFCLHFLGNSKSGLKLMHATLPFSFMKPRCIFFLLYLCKSSTKVVLGGIGWKLNVWGDTTGVVIFIAFSCRIFQCRWHEDTHHTWVAQTGARSKRGGKEMGKSFLIIYHIQQHAREQHLSTYYGGNYAEGRRERKLEIYIKSESCVCVVSPLS